MSHLHHLGLPDALIIAWRVVAFVLVIFVLTGCWVAGRTTKVHSRRWLFAALGVVAVRSLLVQIEWWDHEPTLEILGIDTLYLVLAAIGIRSWAREG